RSDPGQPRLLQRQSALARQEERDLERLLPGLAVGHGEACRGKRERQETTTLLMLSPECIRSKARVMSVSGITWVIIGSISILPSMYQSTIFGTSVRPLAPPNAVPRHDRPVTSWNGRVLISVPAGATPMMML